MMREREMKWARRFEARRNALRQNATRAELPHQLHHLAARSMANAASSSRRRKRRRRQAGEHAAPGDSSDDGREHSPDASDDDRADAFWATPHVVDDEAPLPAGSNSDEAEEEQHDVFHPDIPFGTSSTTPPPSPSPAESYSALLSDGETLEDLEPEEREEFLRQKRERAHEREKKRVEELIRAREQRDREEQEERRGAREEKMRVEEEKWKVSYASCGEWGMYHVQHNVWR